MDRLDEERQLHALVDGELDLASRLELEASLEHDARLRRQWQELEQLRAVVRERADHHPAPEALRRRLQALVSTAASTPEASARPSRIAPARSERGAARLWPAWPRAWAASLAAAAVMGVAGNLVWQQVTGRDRLADEVVASHVRATLGDRLLDVASSDHHTVKPFLSARLGFSPPVDALPLAGSIFKGARVDYLDGRPVAALVYTQGPHVVDSFVWPSTDGDRQPSFGSERGYLTAHWTRAGMKHWVISDVNRQEFAEVVEAIASLGPAH